MSAAMDFRDYTWTDSAPSLKFVQQRGDQLFWQLG
jgi:hypothetical protein